MFTGGKSSCVPSKSKCTRSVALPEFHMTSFPTLSQDPDLNFLSLWNYQDTLLLSWLSGVEGSFPLLPCREPAISNGGQDGDQGSALGFKD